MPEYLAPGVYVEEIDTGNKPIEGVSTSTAGMLGVTERGPVNIPILVTSYGEYTRWFGGRLNKTDFSNGSDAHCYLPYAVEGFFLNGGKRAYITRVLDTVGAKSASTLLFDRGTLESLNTLLLHAASEATGTATHPPLLYVLDLKASDLHPNDPNERIRVGDGSGAEYIQVASNFTFGTPDTTHVALNFSLNRSHNAGDSIDEIPYTPNKRFSLASPDKKNTQRGDQTIVVTGTDSDIGTLATGTLLEIANTTQAANTPQGEYRFVTSVTDVKPIAAPLGHSQATVHLDIGLLISYAPGSIVTSLQIPAATVSDTLATDSIIGDRVVFVNDRHTQFNNRQDLVVIHANHPDSEVRRIGELDRLTLSDATSEMYPAGSTIEAVDHEDDARKLVNSTAVGARIIQLDDVTSLVRGQRLRIGTGSDLELGVIQSVDQSTDQITLTATLANAHAANDPVALAATTLKVAAKAGVNVITLDDRLGLSENDVLRIDNAPNDEYASIKSIPNRAHVGAASTLR